MNQQPRDSSPDPACPRALKSAPSPTSRRPELEDWLNRRIYHPLAHRLALRLVPTGISPNWVSVIGGFCVVMAGIAYVSPGWPLTVAAGLLLHMTWHVLDGADGDLARMTCKSSPAGEIIDGLSDYFSHIALYLMLGALLFPQFGAMAWIAVVGAGVSRIFQASHYEERRREYQWWVYGRAWIRNEPLIARNRTERIMAAIVAFYLSLASRTEATAGSVERLHLAAGRDPARLDGFRSIVRLHLGPLLRPLGLLGANHRTIALGTAMLARRPMWYLFYEFVALNVVLAWSIVAHRTAARAIERDMAAEPAGAKI